MGLFYDRQASYRWCHQATAWASSFYPAFWVLPRVQRRGMEVLYAFMRVTDDLADNEGPIPSRKQALAQWREQMVVALQGDFSHPLHPAFHELVQKYRIPVRLFHDVIDGVETDLEVTQFATFAELERYCYRVASVVGLACIHIWGYQNAKAYEYAESAGIAFQLTNILRDLQEDQQRGRTYLPQEDLHRFHCPPELWQATRPEFQSLMRFQIARANAFYREGEKLTGLLSPHGRAIFGMMTQSYEGLLREIEARNYDVFQKRIRLSRQSKLGLLLRAFSIRWGWS